MTFYMCFDWRVLNWCLVFQLSNKYFYCYFLNSFRFSLLRNLQTNWQVLSALYSQCFRQLKFCLILLFAKLRFGQELFRVLKTFEYLVGINNCITSLMKSPHYNIIIINKRENVSKYLRRKFNLGCNVCDLYDSLTVHFSSSSAFGWGRTP